MTLAIYDLGNSNIGSSDPLAASKQVHGYNHFYSQDSTIAADIGYFGPFRAAGTIIGFEASITEAIATGADRTVTVDLKKSTGGGAFGTVLSAVITFNNGSTLRAVSSATVSSTSVADGDLFSINIVVAGSAGAQAQGLVVRAFWSESYG